MQTLVLDTSGPFTTVLVTSNDELAAVSILQNRPAEHLHEQIHASLTGLHLRSQDLDRIAVILGPGSWTGLNIGVTAAKTMAQVLRIPLCPIPTLDALAALCPKPAWALMNAGRGQCYYARYSASESKEMAIGTLDSVLQQIEEDPASVEIFEYGSTFTEQFEKDPRYHSTLRLLPEALITAIDPARTLEGDAIKHLTPAYLQASFAEREASPGSGSC